MYEMFPVTSNAVRMENIISTTEHVSVPRLGVWSPPTSSSAKYIPSGR